MTAQSPLDLRRLPKAAPPHDLATQYVTRALAADGTVHLRVEERALEEARRNVLAHVLPAIEGERLQRSAASPGAGVVYSLKTQTARAALSGDQKSQAAIALEAEARSVTWQDLAQTIISKAEASSDAALGLSRFAIEARRAIERCSSTEELRTAARELLGKLPIVGTGAAAPSALEEARTRARAAITAAEDSRLATPQRWREHVAALVATRAAAGHPPSIDLMTRQAQAMGMSADARIEQAMAGEMAYQTAVMQIATAALQGRTAVSAAATVAEVEAARDACLAAMGGI